MRDYNDLSQVVLIGENQQSPGFKGKLPAYSRLSPWCNQAWYNQPIWKTLLNYWKQRIRDRGAVSLVTLAMGSRQRGPDMLTKKPGESLSEKNHIFQTLSEDMFPDKGCFPICECIYIKSLRKDEKWNHSYMFNKSPLFGKEKKNYIRSGLPWKVQDRKVARFSSILGLFFL